MAKKFIFISAVAAMLLSACSLDREPLNGPSSGSFPASEEEAEAGILAAYKRLSTLTVKDMPFPRHQDMVSDIGTFRPGNNNQLYCMTSSLVSDNALTEKLFTAIYKTAGRVHLVLDGLDKLEGKISEEKIKSFKAELLLIRDYYYDLGCQHYGDIPFVDHCLTLDDYQYPRQKRDSITQVILFTDLVDDVLDALPLQWSQAQWGTTRVDRSTAYAVKARIALNWGYFEEAARCSKKAMEYAQGVHSLQTLDYKYYATAADGEPDPTPLFGYEGQNSSEWMWALQYNKLISSNFTQHIYYAAPRNVNGCSWFGPSQAMMDTFQCTDGLPITESPLYDWTKPYENRDPRLDLFTCRNGSRVMGIEYSTDGRVATVHDYNTNNDIPNSDSESSARNKSEYGPNGRLGPGGYLWRKYLDKTYLGLINGSSKTEDDLNVGIMRYAELLLIDAEANIEMKGGDLARAASDINQVRARVGMPPVTDHSQAGLRKALRYERKVELANEGYRWFDIRRWNIATKAVNGPMWAPPLSPEVSNTDPLLYLPNAKPVIDDDWVVKYDENSTWNGKKFNLRKLYSRDCVYNDAKDRLWPFPKTELDANPKGNYQNPGY